MRFGRAPSSEGEKGLEPKVIGFIYADKKFDYRMIDQDMTDVLDTFADFAAATIHRYDMTEYIERASIDISHHLKTPLTSIDQFSGEVNRHFKENSTQQIPSLIWKYMEGTKVNAAFGLELTDKIMNLRELKQRFSI